MMPIRHSRHIAREPLAPIKVDSAPSEGSGITRTLFVLPMLSGIGGIQASLLNLVESLPNEYEVTLCVFANRIAPETEVPARARVVHGPPILEYCLADFQQARHGVPVGRMLAMAAVKVLQRAIGYRRLLDLALRGYRVPGEYDVAISYANDIYSEGGGFVGGANDIVARGVKARRKIAWIHNDPRKHGLDEDICLRTYGDFDAVVNVSAECKRIFDGIAPALAKKSFVVNNFEKEHIRDVFENPYEGEPAKTHLVTVARLDNQQKRIDRVIEACSLLRDEGYNNFKWHIVGDGPDVSRLTALADERGVGQWVVFEGRKANASAYIKNADVFVLASDYEAYPMVLTESLSLGVPVISTRYPGVEEIVVDMRNGILVERRSQELAEAVARVMEDESILERLRANIADEPRNNTRPLSQFTCVVQPGNGDSFARESSGSV